VLASRVIYAPPTAATATVRRFLPVWAAHSAALNRATRSGGMARPRRCCRAGAALISWERSEADVLRKFLAFLGKHWLVILGLTLSVATIFTFFMVTDGVATIKQIYQSLQYGWLLLAMLFVILQWVFDALGLHVLAVPHQPKRRFLRSFITMMVGVLYSALTPSATGGQPMQVVSLGRQGMDAGTATSVIVVKTALNHIAIALYALVMVFWELPFFQAHVSQFSFIVLFAMAASIVFIAGLFLFTVNQRLTRRIGAGFVHLLHKMHLCRDEARLMNRMDTMFEQFFTSSRTIAGSAWRCIGVVVFTILQLTCYFIIPYCLYRSFGFYGVTVVRMVAAATFVYFASMFVPVPGASGGAEGSFYLFFSPFFPAGAIAPAVLLWRLLTYYLAIVVGMVFTTMDKRVAPDAGPTPARADAGDSNGPTPADVTEQA
jgi:hypothetical protein